MSDPDRSHLIAAVAARLKIRLDEDDPAFVIIELNRLILGEIVKDALHALCERVPAPNGESPKTPSGPVATPAPSAGDIAHLVSGHLFAKWANQRPTDKAALFWAITAAFASGIICILAGYALGRSGASLFA